MNAEPCTPQHVYFAQLSWFRRNAMPDQVARLRGQGPPPPVEADGYWGHLAYYEFMADREPGYAASAAMLRTTGAARWSATPEHRSGSR